MNKLSISIIALMLSSFACTPKADEKPTPKEDVKVDVKKVEAKAATPKKEEKKMTKIAVPKNLKAAPADATKTASGLAYKVLKKGTGTVHPTATSKVEVHYSGWDKTGKMFDSSVQRGQKISFGLNQVIKGWTEGVQLMVVGEKTRFWIPAEMAYGEVPSRPGAPAGMLIFDVELFDIK